MAPASRFQFGEFTLEVGTRQLLEEGRVVHLSSKAFDLLHLLLDRRPHLVERKELLERLWPETFVSDVNLATLVAELRRALHDEPADPRFIRTVHRHGYAFSGAATQNAEGSTTRLDGPSTHWILWQSGQVRLTRGENILGRGRRVTVWLDSPSISRRHARIVVTGADAALEDLGSRNGTYVRGVKVGSPTRLQDGDEIRLGSVVLTYRLNSGQETTISTPA